MNKQKPLMWIIAGQDSSGGAGIVADTLTAHDFQVSPAVVITALTAQNSQQLLGVKPCEPEFLQLQLQAINPLRPKAIKIGMVADAAQLKVLNDTLKNLREEWPNLMIVIDPVLVTSSGYSLGEHKELRQFDELFAQATLITPNANELAQLTGQKLTTPAQFATAASALARRCGCAVLAKGGHTEFDSALVTDLLCVPQPIMALTSGRIDTAHSHGTGCSLSSAIAALLARGESLNDAVTIAKAYISQGLRLAHGQAQLPGAVAHRGWPNAGQDYPKVESSQSEIGELLGLAGYWPTPSVPIARCDAPLGVYPVVDDVHWIERLLKAGVRTIQLRIKDPQQADLAEQVQKAVALGEQYKAQLFINDHWRLALRYGAYGVHLGQDDIEAGRVDIAAIARSGMRLGVSSHGEYQLLRALAIEPSYVAIGAIFATDTKPLTEPPLGVERLKRAVDLIAQRCPSVAIGGINLDNAREVLATGVSSLAVVSAITHSDVPEQAMRQLEQWIQEE